MVHIDIKCVFGALANPLRRQTFAIMGMLARTAALHYGAQGMGWPGVGARPSCFASHRIQQLSRFIRQHQAADISSGTYLAT